MAKKYLDESGLSYLWSKLKTIFALATHTHSTSIESSTGTSQITLSHGSKYSITAGGTSYIFTMPASGNTDTKVAEAYSTANNSYPLLMTATAGISSTSSRGATTSILNNQIYGNPSTGTITATKFNGSAEATTAYGTANLKNVVISNSDASNPSSYPTGTVWLKYGGASLPTMADYVVEEGSSDIWTYRKWNSGLSECWGKQIFSSVATTTAWGSVYYGTLTSTLSFPSGLFLDAPEINTFLRSQGGRFWCTHSNNASATSAGTIYALAPQSYSSGSAILNIYAQGTWK